ncbi:ABC transporter ATP-binding protein [Brevibacillus sp. TJ4]|uniref:ABC transporter ATP-binding protein n=1 Tax=Brevibacillus sp. TJ4 TaxID=3234853 RepID=UPI0037D78F5F
MAPILDVQQLHVGYQKKGKYTEILKGVTFALKKGESLGIVGESGCGKSMTSLAIMGLLKQKGVQATRGKINWEGSNLLDRKNSELRNLRGKEIAMIFQEPMTALNPLLTVGQQITEQIRVHEGIGKKEAELRAIEMLRLVNIPSPVDRLKAYPHELSGGMRQRVMIAMALSCQPKLLIADEPTTALDVTVQAQILDLLQQLQQQMGMSLMLITHDLGVVSQVCQRVIVMYAGEVVEEATREQLFSQPLHPYTIGLLESVTSLDGENERLYSIPGRVPAPGEAMVGCAFQDRCPYVAEACRKTTPSLVETEDGRKVSCLRYSEIVEGVA